MAAWAAGERFGRRIPGLPRLMKLGLGKGNVGAGNCETEGCSSTMETSGSTREMVIPLGSLGP